MAFKLPNIKFNFFSHLDARSRIFFLLAAVVGIGFFVYLGLRFFTGATDTTGPSRVASAPGGLQSVPGGQLTPEYYRALAQANVQAAQQAQISGGSAVPTLVNIPGQQPQPLDAAGIGQCNIICPEESSNVKYDLDDWVKQGSISPDLASQLQEMANQNVPVEQYAAMLDQLVKSGKLTPEQARQLLARYKAQHANALLQQSANAMDNLIKSGQLPLSVANQLLALQKEGVSPAQYANALNRLVAEGKISPDTAQQLLAQYAQQRAQEMARQGEFQLQQMAQQGQITPDVEKELADLLKQNLPVSQYAAALRKLVAEGKLTPAVAAKLLAQYQKQRLALGPNSTLNDLTQQAHLVADRQLEDLVKNKQLTPEAAAQLANAMHAGTSQQDYQALVNKLVAEKQLSPDAAKSLMDSYQKLLALRKEAQQLQALQGNNASLGEYVNALKQAVRNGVLTPQAAAALAQEYQALTMPLPANLLTVGATADTSEVPSTADFTKLQQQLQQAESGIASGVTPTGVPTGTPEDVAQFTAAEQQAQAAAVQARAERIQALMSEMSAQSQQLITSWQPPAMSYREWAAATSSTSKETSATGKAGGGSAAAEAAKSAVIKAGTIAFAVLDTAVDSDYPTTPVMATIVSGPFKGAKLLGKLSVTQSTSGQLDRVGLSFNLMNMDAWSQSKSINAFAIDPDTARTVLASQVDYHYLKRYGAMMASSFITGYANAITTSGATTTTGIFGTSTTHPQLSPGQNIAVGLGQVGQTIGNTVQNYVNIPPTVKVDSGVGLGILFMSDVTV